LPAIVRDGWWLRGFRAPGPGPLRTGRAGAFGVPTPYVSASALRPSAVIVSQVTSIRRREGPIRTVRIRRDHPVSLHGVCMSIGGHQPLDRAHLARFGALVERYEPALVSEHLAWSTHETTYFNDLLPLPYTQATLAQVCEHIDEVQDAIGRRILIENPSTYVAFASSTMSETDSAEAGRQLLSRHSGPASPSAE
jgi:hypothetical protein